ncbi:MAG: hypothetical protein QG614_264, partial [Patescibacteria group bacterium]|nr:hypothetical protein [Patescibacteria group bacterium]
MNFNLDFKKIKIFRKFYYFIIAFFAVVILTHADTNSTKNFSFVEKVSLKIYCELSSFPFFWMENDKCNILNDGLTLTSQSSEQNRVDMGVPLAYITNTPSPIVKNSVQKVSEPVTNNNNLDPNETTKTVYINTPPLITQLPPEVNTITKIIHEYIYPTSTSALANSFSTPVSNGWTGGNYTVTSHTVNTVDTSVSGTNLTTTVNGVATTTDLSSLVASSTSNTLTISTSTNSFTLVSNVNGIIATTTGNIVNSHTLSNDNNNLLTSMVNGVTATSSLITSNIVSAAAGLVTTNINGVIATTSVDNLYTFLASSTNSNLQVSTTTDGRVVYELTDNPIFNSINATSSNIKDLNTTNSTSTNLFTNLLNSVTGYFNNLFVDNLNATNTNLVNATS